METYYKVVHRIKAGSERSAERIENGVLINLNHDAYYTRIVTSQHELRCGKLD